MSAQLHERSHSPRTNKNDKESITAHGQNPLLTPSTYEDNPTATWRREIDSIPGASNSSFGSSTDSGQHRPTSHMPRNDSANSRQYLQGTHDQDDAQEAGSLMDQLATLGDCPNPVDGAVFPFEGYNVEDLWNWMLYFDSPGVLDGLS